jgi:hypothetical protein
LYLNSCRRQLGIWRSQISVLLLKLHFWRQIGTGNYSNTIKLFLNIEIQEVMCLIWTNKRISLYTFKY